MGVSRGSLHAIGRNPSAQSDAVPALHDVGNVCVMDASDFLSGWANPTLTIMALTMRSTDHLLERMRAGEI